MTPTHRGPLIEEISVPPTAENALQKFAAQPAVLLLESCLQREPVGRYSFLTADPFELIRLQRAEYGFDPFERIRNAIEHFTTDPIADLPPFQGGAAGLFSYELGHCWEQFPRPLHDDFQLPAMVVGLYDWVIAWDHEANRAWIISQGFPETDPHLRRQRATQRLNWVREILKSGTGVTGGGLSGSAIRGTSENTSGRAARGTRANENHSSPVRQWPAPGPSGLTSDFSRDEYLRSVERVIEYIAAGDIFQANLSQRLLYPQKMSELELYQRLRRANPAPFAGYFGCDDWTVVSASPERFVRIDDGAVETRPIKGTRRRAAGPEADLFTRDELRESGKDQAENVMIVDLLRNDLSRVCLPNSISVPRLCAVETYETVQHLVSEIRGQLAANATAWDLFRVAFPGGSITGAPKVRAMEIISELEPTARGPYCGNLFYVGFDGNADSNILIRTFVCRHGWIQCSVGGGIVAQSDPVAEYEETLHKAEGMLRALR